MPTHLRGLSPPKPLGLMTSLASLLALVGPVLAASLPSPSEAESHRTPAGMTEEVVARVDQTLHLIHPQDPPKGLVLFYLGAKGWDAAAADMCAQVAGRGYLVVGIDWSTRVAPQPRSPWWDPGHYLRRLADWLMTIWSDQATEQAPTSCWDLGIELSNLAHWVETRENLPEDALPILMGEAEGAALVCAALLQSPSRSFHAAVGLGLCPRWPSSLPPCERGGVAASLIHGDQLLLAAEVPSPWFLFEGGANEACSPEQTTAFVKGIGNARMATGGSVPTAPSADGDDLSPLASLFQWLDPRIPNQVGLVSAQAGTAGLPLTEIRAPEEDPRIFAVMLSGDGGWAALDRGVSATLAAKGISTVGWDSLGYYWKARSPDEATRDLTRVLRHYLDAWQKERVMLIGYSFGADVLPFLANGLPPELRGRVELLVFLGLGPAAMFEFHLSDWLATGRGEDALPVLPQIQNLGWTRSLCVYGADEDDSLCPALKQLGVDVLKVPGDHHFGGDYAGVAALILRAVVDAQARASVN